jgi:hypothetical protein
MLRLLIIIFAVSSYLFSQNENRRDKFISLHVGEPIYLSFSMDLFKQHRIKLYSGLGTLDLIGYQDYSKKYIDGNMNFYRSRSMILVDSTYLHNIFSSKVYPNPGNGLLTIELSDAMHFPYWVRIYSLAGTLLRERLVVQPVINERLNDLSKGLYIIKIENETEQNIHKLSIY